MKTHFTPILLITLALALTLASCSDGSSDSDGSGSATSITTSSDLGKERATYQYGNVVVLTLYDNDTYALKSLNTEILGTYEKKESTYTLSTSYQLTIKDGSFTFFDGNYHRSGTTTYQKTSGGTNSYDSIVFNSDGSLSIMESREDKVEGKATYTGDASSDGTVTIAITNGEGTRSGSTLTMKFNFPNDIDDRSYDLVLKQ